MTKFTKTTLATLFTFSAAGASAAAFQLAEVSTSGLGMAYAGNAAVANDASVVATNPALMTKFKQIEISAGGVYVDGNVNIVEGNFAVQTKVNGTTIQSTPSTSATAKDIIPSAFVPNLYIVAPITERFTLGGGINVNYGLKSEFPKNYNAGIFAGKTELTAINYNLSGAYELGYGFSAGAGLNVVHAKATLERHFGALNPAAPTLTASRLKGDDLGFGWNVGLAYDINENNRLGIAYHSPVDLRFKGKYIGTQSANEVPGSLELELPAYWEISGYHKLTDKLAVQYSYKKTHWNSFKELRATGNDGRTLLQKDENFNANSRIALGLSYDVIDALTLRTGIAYDESASVKHPSISIPDTDRTWYTLGATYRFTPNLSVDLAYAHLRGSKSSFTENQVLGAQQSANGIVSREAVGTFKVKSTANLYGLNVNYKF